MKPRFLPDDLLRSIATAHGTPLYVYDLDAVALRLAELAGFVVAGLHVHIGSGADLTHLSTGRKFRSS